MGFRIVDREHKYSSQFKKLKDQQIATKSNQLAETQVSQPEERDAERDLILQQLEDPTQKKKFLGAIDARVRKQTSSIVQKSVDLETFLNLL